MRKSIIIALMFLILLAASCGRQDKEQKTTGEAKDKTIEYKELEPIDLEQDAVSVTEYMDGDIYDVIYFDSSKLVYFVDKESPNPDTGIYDIYLYEKSTGESKLIIEVPDVNASRGDICVLGNKIYYTFWRMTDGIGYNSLVEIDMEKKTAQLIPINATDMFVDIAVTDNHAFILKRNEVNARRTDYIIERLDGQKLTEISSVAYILGETEGEDEGELYLDFMGEEDYLYLFKKGAEYINNGFICMTEDGEIKETYGVDIKEDLKLEMEDFPSSDGEEEWDSLWEILKNGDYYVIGTLNHRNFIYRKQGKGIVKIPAPEQLGSKDLTYGSNIIKGFGKGRYIYFKEIENNVIDVLDTQTETFGHMEVKVDGEIGFVMGNKENQFLFSVRRKDGTYDFMIYEGKEI